MQRLADRNLVTSVVLLAVGGIATYASGDDVKNWMFPLLAAYVMLSIGAMLIARFLYVEIIKSAPDLLRMSESDRVAAKDVTVFAAIILVYIVVMTGIGFWISSFLMLCLTSVYLTLDKSRRNIMLALVVPIGACIAAYIIFLQVFYVPFPKAAWIPGLD